ncbi:alkaline phosphatase family protein [Cryobacterium mannosilyticum]|uniref:Phosphoesterase n=1 Tax=Cryobacterium mannosilyticum TaxID=1259190 RepID=A0A4R8WA42_9MICO|nr:alkaline phosphatase family protein [Cryobacterium mannosilyticum]TFC05097.1 phosphoesterase [Cryobacterium mannosilyticum]
MSTPRVRWFVGTAVVLLLAVAAAALWQAGGPRDASPVNRAGPTNALAAPAAPVQPGVQHITVINLENKGYDQTWGSGSPAPYLSSTLRDQGVLLTQYFGVAHHSLPNYIAQISGQGPNPQTQSDCQTYTAFDQTGTAAFGQAVGEGCVYPAGVPTVAGQLTGTGRTWKGYSEDMGQSCRHPAPGDRDDTQRARPGDQYAARHNPFVYFAGITGSPDCARNVLDLDALPAALAAVDSTPNLAIITPNLCHDGHDAPCVDGEAGGLAGADGWLRDWVPRILASPAFRQDGMLVITFDESDSVESDSTACCGESAGPNADRPGIDGPGGGRVGALVLSPFISGGTESNTPYNHYSLLASIEDAFGLPYLGYASAPGLARFGADVFRIAP